MSKPPPIMSGKAITAVVTALVALLSLVIIVGLAQKQLDPTGVAVMLGSSLSGIVAGVLFKNREKDDDEGKGDS